MDSVQYDTRRRVVGELGDTTLGQRCSATFVRDADTFVLCVSPRAG